VRHVQRGEILDYVTYEETRDELRASVFAAKKIRRIHVGPHVTLLFENHETIRYQIHEMMRVERMVREEDILHEIETYNELVGGPGELGCTLMVEIRDEEERREKLREWTDLPESVHAVLEDGSRVGGTSDERQRDEEKVSAVQFMKFDTGGRVPVAFEVDVAGYNERVELDEDQRGALGDDLD